MALNVPAPVINAVASVFNALAPVFNVPAPVFNALAPVFNVFALVFNAGVLALNAPALEAGPGEPRRQHSAATHEQAQMMPFRCAGGSGRPPHPGPQLWRYTEGRGPKAASRAPTYAIGDESAALTATNENDRCGRLLGFRHGCEYGARRYRLL